MRREERRDPARCPLCGAGLGRIANRTRFQHRCAECNATLQAELWCTHCNTQRVWRGSGGAYCHGCGHPQVEHIDAEPSRRAADPPAQFTVRGSFHLTGRGTVALGFTTSGVAHTGDWLKWTSTTGDRRTARCIGVELINQRPLLNPPSIGLLVSDVEPADFVEGMIISVSRPSARPAAPD